MRAALYITSNIIQRRRGFKTFPIAARFLSISIPQRENQESTTFPASKDEGITIDDDASDASLPSDSKIKPKPWEDPLRFAYGPLKEAPKFTDVIESKEEWKWVERLMPMKVVPEVPHHDSYPTPSGWFPPRSK